MRIMITRMTPICVGTAIAKTALLCLLAVPLQATPPFGFISQTFRGQITGNVHASQWESALFSLLIQSSASPDFGYDVVQGTTEFAAVDVMGRPSQSGWHDHPTALSIGLVVQGTVWSHEKSNLSCLRAISTGSVFFERSGEIHNNYNLDPKTPAIVRIIHFVERGQPATRRDQPDQVTGDSAVAAPPPAPCPAESAASAGPRNGSASAIGVLFDGSSSVVGGDGKHRTHRPFLLETNPSRFADRPGPGKCCAMPSVP